ncbi:hypothetical protein [Novosphingobium lentum]|uniref:hypothetical protein n=1 Tax=Novosphingobium lentum TaxID=145287 RepID=UPI000A6C47DD|nr:hypothetical protein [Novosphingobium lentum]
MISASANTAALFAQLVRQAQALAQARAAMAAQGRNAARWRSASLLWPLFGQEGA